ncbi:SigE family RNA polymerase sigma factor [Nocardioides terrisoli]|uniref:SigE family RNA polymerase sigma factor n=1 Tax=Nocardioides terrisoli TaxID=3388267 RepID=UPI00287B7934|nr:SigE family RNA polymerase sigma factor [Nocardioides marmorisolisilvae]
MALGDSSDSDFEELVAARWDSWARLATLLAGGPQDAEDFLQSAMVAVYAKWPRVRRADRPDAYIVKVLVNTIVSARRRAAVGQAKLKVVGSAQPWTDTTDDDVDRLDLWAQVRQLPPRQRAVLVLRYYEDMTVRETADLLGCSEGTVKSQSSDALRTLGRSGVRLSSGEEREPGT